MAIYSHTRLGSFEQCPRKYWYAYVAKVKVEVGDTIEAFLGTRVHDSLEELYRRALNGQVMGRADLVGFYDAKWKEEWHPDVLIVSPTYKKGDYQRVGRKALQTYHDRYHPFDQSQTLALECNINLDLDGTGRYRLTGYVDRLAQRADGVYEVHDYKTNKGLPSQADVDEDRQLALYHLGVQNQWKDAKKVDLIWHFVRFDKEIRSSRTTEQLQAVKNDCIQVIDRIESLGTEEVKFLTQPSNLCRWCAFQEVCPVTRHAASVGKLKAKDLRADDGVRLVDQVARLEEKRQNLKAQVAKLDAKEDQLLQQILALAQQLGVESVAGRTYHVDVVTKSLTKFPGAGDLTREAFEKAIRKAGLWDQLATLNHQKLKSLWNRGLAPEALKLLAKYVTEEKTIVLKLKKGGVRTP